MTTSRRASLLVVLAHPDDEIFHGGILAHLSTLGVRVTLVCATNGEAGKAHPSVGTVDDLGALRTEELRLSCQRLGIDPPVLLGFHDSARGERQRHDDGRALANVDMLEVEHAIRQVIVDVKPHVILTFDPHGGYYHPDHLAVQRATTAAFFSSGTMGAAAPERLFYGTLLRDVFRRLADDSRGRGITDGLDPDVFGTAPEMVAVSFDASSFVRRKFLALAAHRSAFGVTEEMVNGPHAARSAMLDAFDRVFAREAFVLGGTRIPIAKWPLRDFFEGMTSAEFACVTLSEG
ncbi:MAG TPA: PIG-L deacetylase family protein [Vicinamibacterales bacterium]|nr:PIG-L deacetylase family protein [Vicinamibacterales bacterium]